MKVFAPNYYKKFHCIADKCKHSCCIGWEIDIDEDTLELYNNVKGTFGDKLRKNIEIDNNCASFKLGENERCPFLNESNLCDIILNLGEDSLCQICSDHPRFRNFYSNRIEMGLGLACEGTTRIIVNGNTSFQLIMLEDAESPTEPYENELDFFKLRADIFEIIDSNSTFEVITETISKKFSIKFPEKSLNEWIDIYLKLERLDDNWDNLLTKAKSHKNTSISIQHQYEKPLKNLLTYFIYRHLGESVYDNNFNGRLLFAFLSCYLISALCNVEDNIEEVARMYSSEIEYSDENLIKLIELLQKESLKV